MSPIAPTAPRLAPTAQPHDCSTSTSLLTRYREVRARTEEICAGLEPEDYVPQPIADVSPPKWHLAHTTWFFETFLLSAELPGYAPFDERFAYLFNSYYEAAGPRILRTHRGNLTRPSTDVVYAYRAHVDGAMAQLLRDRGGESAVGDLVALGLQHEQQHQELLVTDILYTLGHNPLFPAFAKTDSFLGSDPRLNVAVGDAGDDGWLDGPTGVAEIGYAGEGFCFDNELGRHRVYLEPHRLRRRCVTAGEYLDFMDDGGYERVELWLSEGWAFAKTLEQAAPLHWHIREGSWWRYTPAGLVPVDREAPVAHVSYYEADAYARWAGARLPTEFEWEASAPALDWGQVWEWTSSAYGPYPGFRTAPGALGEYNGKWMVNQQVLRGASVATAPGHSRPTYRNFFHADKRWQYTGIRLAGDH